MNLSEVLPLFGNNKAELARSLDLTRQAVQKWEQNGGDIPREHALALRYEILPTLVKSHG